jgi:AcrR family transcriptional regulator
MKSVGRPKVSKKEIEHRKKRVVEAAKALFMNHGYQSVSMRNIAKEVGLSPMMLYKIFNNKRAIIHHIWDEIFNDIYRYCVESIDFTELSNERALYHICTKFVNYWIQNPEYYNVVFMESDRLEEKGDKYFYQESKVISLLETLENIVRKIIKEHSDKLTEENIDAEAKLRSNLLVLQLQGILHGFIILNELPWGSLDSLVNETLRSFIISCSIPSCATYVHSPESATKLACVK